MVSPLQKYKTNYDQLKINLNSSKGSSGAVMETNLGKHIRPSWSVQLYHRLRKKISSDTNFSLLPLFGQCVVGIHWDLPSPK